MKNNHRIVDHPVLGSLPEKDSITFTFDGKEYSGLAGDTIASALLANGVRTLRVHEASGKPRGIYCNIGHCFECRVTVNSTSGVRACLTEIKDGMVIESGKPEAQPFASKNVQDFPRTYAEFEKKAKSERR